MGEKRKSFLQSCYLKTIVGSRYNHYNKNLKQFARANRKQMTQGEVLLWDAVLRRRQLLGKRFLRQRPVDRYIADFMCPELKLVIEVDGLSHDNEYQYHRDKVRDMRLAELGFKTIRIPDSDILNDLLNVERMLMFEVVEREREFGEE